MASSHPSGCVERDRAPPFDRAECPNRLPAVENRQNEVVFRRKMAIESGFCDARGDNDLVHRNIPHGTPGEQSVSGIDDALMGIGESGTSDGPFGTG